MCRQIEWVVGAKVDQIVFDGLKRMHLLVTVVKWMMIWYREGEGALHRLQKDTLIIWSVRRRVFKLERVSV